MNPWYLSHLIVWGAEVALGLGSLWSAFGVLKSLKNVYHYKSFNLDLKSASQPLHRVTFYHASKRLLHEIGFLTYSSLQFELPPSLHLFLWAWFLVLTLTVNYVLSLTLVTEDEFRVDLAAGAGAACTLVSVAVLLMVEAVYVSGLNQTNRLPDVMSQVYLADPGRSADLSNVNTVLQPPSKPVRKRHNSTDKTRLEAMETNNATTRRQSYLDMKRPDAPELTFRMDIGSASNEQSVEEVAQEKEGNRDERATLELVTLMMMMGVVGAAFWGAYVIEERGDVQLKSCFLMWLVGIGLDIPLRLLLSFFLSLLGLLPNFSLKYISLDYGIRKRDLHQFSKSPKRPNADAIESLLSPNAKTTLLRKDQGDAVPEQTLEAVLFPSQISEEHSPGRRAELWPALMQEKAYNPTAFSRYDEYVEKLQHEEMRLSPPTQILENQPDPEQIAHTEKEAVEIVESVVLKESELMDETDKSSVRVSISEHLDPSSESNASSLSEISEDCHIDSSELVQPHEEAGQLSAHTLSEPPASSEALEAPQSPCSVSDANPFESAVVFSPANRPKSDLPEVLITTEIDASVSSSPREPSSSQAEEIESGLSLEAGGNEHSEPEPGDLDTADRMRKQSPEAIVPHITFGDQFPIPTENERFSDIFSTARGTQGVFPSQYMEEFPEPQRPHFSPQVGFTQSRPSHSRPPKPKTASRISLYDQQPSLERSFRRSQSSSSFNVGRLGSQGSEGMKTPTRQRRELAEISSDSDEDISVISPMNPVASLKPHKSQSSFLRSREQGKRPVSPEATDGERYQVPSRPGTTLFEPEGSPISADGHQFRFSSGQPMPEAEYEADAFNRPQSPSAANADKVSFRTSETSTSRTALQPISYGREAERQRIASELHQLARTQGYKGDVNLQQLSHVLAARVEFHKKYGYQASDFESPYEEILWQMMKDDPVPKRLTVLGDEDERSQLAKLKSLYERYKAGSSRPGGELNRHGSLSSIGQRSRKVTPEMSHTRKKLYQMMSSRSEANFQLAGEQRKVGVMNGPIREDPVVEDHSTPNNQKLTEAWK